MGTRLRSKALIYSGFVGILFAQTLLADDFSQWVVGPNLSQTPDINGALRSVQSDPIVQSTLRSHTASLRYVGRVASKFLVTTKFQATYRGLDVVGSLALHHAGAKGSQVTSQLANFDLDVNPKLTLEEAAQIARNLNRDREIQTLPTLKILPSENQDSAQLIYWVKVQARGMVPSTNVLIDAHTGHVIANVPDRVSIAPVDVYSADGTPNADIDPRSGAPLRFNFNTMPKMVSAGVTADGADASALRAASNSQKVLQYYADHHGRNSYDDRGSTTISIVHAGQNFSNAFWSVEDSIMAYGDGDGIRTTDFTKAVDVAGHEMTHGVVASTSNLTMFGEAGALNEALADFFGKMIEGADDWVMGRGIFLDPNMKGFRDLANPGSIMEYTVDDFGRTVATPDPANLKDEIMASSTCSEDNDYCYVHANSTIASHTEYLITQALGKASAEKLIYAVMTQYLTERSGFRMFRTAIQKACLELLDSNSCDAVNNALATTGLLD